MKAYLQNGVFRAILSTLSIVIIFAILTWVIKGTVQPESKDIALMVVGALIGQLNQIYGYYFGSSDKSVTKEIEKQV